LTDTVPEVVPFISICHVVPHTVHIVTVESKVGAVDNTTLFVQVVEIALIAVQFHCSIQVIAVVNVIAGVLVAFATVQAKPFALTTLTFVTVHKPAVVQG